MLSLVTQFFEDRLLTGCDKFRKQIKVNNVEGNAREARVEAVQQVEDELQVEDGAVDITERIGGGLHILVVLVGEVALGHGVELVAKEDGTRSIVRLEEGLDGRPKLFGRLVQRDVEAENIIRHAAEQPAMDTRVADRLGLISRACHHRVIDV